MNGANETNDHVRFGSTATVENRYLEKIRLLTMKVMNGENTKIYLFGSWARGTAKHHSDVDIAIEYKEASNKRKIADLREILEESNIPYSVDVVDMKFAAEDLCREIKKEGILWRDYPHA